MKKRGLYITLEKDGKIKRTLVNSKGEIKLEDTTINDELIYFAELDFQTYIDSFCEIARLSEETEIEGEDHYGEVNMDTFHKLLTETNELLYDIEDKFDVLGTLLRLSLKDNTAEDDGSAMYVYETKSKICDCIYEPIQIFTTIREILDSLAFDEESSKNNQKYNLETTDFVQVCTFENSITAQYRFRSIKNYYMFLLMHFLETKSNVAWCYCCGQYFIPKTRKFTKYCDRIIKNGKTCKEIAPAIVSKTLAEKDIVIKTFQRTKQKMYKRFERASNSLEPLPKGLTIKEFYDWRDPAAEARTKYLLGEISAEEALKIIEVND